MAAVVSFSTIIILGLLILLSGFGAYVYVSRSVTVAAVSAAGKYNLYDHYFIDGLACGGTVVETNLKCTTALQCSNIFALSSAAPVLGAYNSRANTCTVYSFTGPLTKLPNNRYFTVVESI